MVWKNEAIEKLKRYEAKRIALEGIPLEIKEMELRLQSIRSPGADSSTPKGGSVKREDAVLNSITYRDELEISFKQTRIWVKRMDKALGAMTEEERMILERFYITPEKKAADRLAGDLHVDIKTIYRRKDDALRKFTMALYGVTET